MDAASSPVGVAVGSPPPLPPPRPIVLAPSVIPPLAAVPVWTRASQASTAVLLATALGLLGWHAWTTQQRACRPTILQGEAVHESRLDLNRADRAALLQLPGIGEGLARRIEDYRREHGPFRSIEELRQVEGVGPRLLERLRPLVEVQGAASVDRYVEAVPLRRSGRKQTVDAAVDVNAASIEQLQHLPGIGPKMAQRIVQTRVQRPFRSVEELRRVPGIGAKTLERLRPHVAVSSPR